MTHIFGVNYHTSFIIPLLSLHEIASFLAMTGSEKGPDLSEPLAEYKLFFY
jgi:hypothetical protein